MLTSKSNDLFYSECFDTYCVTPSLKQQARLITLAMQQQAEWHSPSASVRFGRVGVFSPFPTYLLHKQAPVPHSPTRERIPTSILQP